MRFIILSIFAVIGISAGLPQEAKLDATVQFITSEELAKLKENDPALVLTRMERNTKGRALGQLLYTIGSRVSGDQLVSQASDYQNWGYAQDIRLTFQYPASGQGAIVTFLSVLVEQSTNIGEAYVVSGGVGYRNILVYVDAYQTTFFSYLAQVYGIY